MPSAWTWSEPKTPKKLSWGKSPNTRRREVERSHATSNRVSLITTRILKIRDQRLAREIGLLRPEIQRITPQRLCDVSLTPGNVARIFATRTWPTETALAGWASRIRTAKCHLLIRPLKSRMNFARFRYTQPPETFPARAVKSWHTPFSCTACPADGIRTGLILGRSDIPRRTGNVRFTSTAPKHSHRSETRSARNYYRSIQRQRTLLAVNRKVKLHLAYEKDVLRQSARYRPENTERQDDDVQRGRYKSWKSEGRTGCRSRYAIKLRSVDTLPSRRCERREDARLQPRCAHPLIALPVNARMFSLGPRIVPPPWGDNDAPSVSTAITTPNTCRTPSPSSQERRARWTCCSPNSECMPGRFLGR